MRLPPAVPVRLAPALLLGLALTAGDAAAQARPLERGMVITTSTRIRPGTYRLPADASLDSALIVVRGEGIVLDLTGVRLEGTAPEADPDAAQGVAIRVEGGRDVTILGVTLRGYRFGVLARGTRGLTVAGTDLSYGWKPRLFSLVGHESLVDWLSFHQNEQREWMRFGAALYLEDVRGGTIRDNRAEQGMNGLLMTRTDSVVVRDNVFAFNSGLGIGLYRSSDNVILRNRLDYDVRGYSHGWYRRGQDSAGLLMFEQCQRNLVAWNSVTHSGDGLFLWAGQQTMDSGQGGANDNAFVGNDFSFAPTNGIEATFSRNRFLGNRVEGNDHGLWGGYSYESVVAGNCFARNRIAIAIEHGQDNVIRRNGFRGDTTALYLWADPIEPSDWGYPKHRDTRSRNYTVADNAFAGHRTTWRVTQTEAFDTTANRVRASDAAYAAGIGPAADGSAAPGDTLAGRVCVPTASLDGVDAPLARRLDAVAGAGPRAIPAAPWSRRERAAIVVDEWGPYDWRSPKLWPVDTMTDAVRLRTLGPAGRWRVVAMDGVRGVSTRTGRIGDTLLVRVDPAREHEWRLTLEYVGAATVSPRGVRAPAGAPVRFTYGTRTVRTDWRVRYVAWTDTLLDPARAAGNLERILAGRALLERREPRLDVQWYRPRLGLPPQRWALDATATVDVPDGVHTIRVISDDAATVWVDGREVVARREPGGSEVMYAPLAPGRHEVRVAYYQLGGWAELRVELVPGAPRSTGSAGPH